MDRYSSVWINDDFTKKPLRYGAYSMIYRRNGMKESWRFLNGTGYSARTMRICSIHPNFERTVAIEALWQADSTLNPIMGLQCLAEAGGQKKSQKNTERPCTL